MYTKPEFSDFLAYEQVRSFWHESPGDWNFGAALSDALIVNVPFRVGSNLGELWP